MGKKKRRHPDIEEVLTRPWCYYCERDFEDLKLLISHQKAKHFKCDRCGRRLNTAGGLSVHLNQVHKENLEHVENALPNRSGLDVEIFGMEGIPTEILDQHRNRIIQSYYQAQEDRRVATGNPVPGQNTKNPRKKVKIETMEELMERFAEHRAQLRAIKTAGASGAGLGAPPNPSYASSEQAFQQPDYSAATAGTQSYPGQQFSPSSFANLPPRPAAAAPAAAPPGLPQRPPAYQGSFYNGQAPPPGYAGAASTLDELVSSGAVPPSSSGDDIDQLIRMAEAGIKPPKRPLESGSADAPVDKRARKEKGRMVYDDSEVSPEERMATLRRYAFSPA